MLLVFFTTRTRRSWNRCTIWFYEGKIIMISASGWIIFLADSQNTKIIEVGSIYAGEVNPVLQWTTFSFSECSWHTPPANRKRWPHWWDRWYQMGKGFIVRTLWTGWPASCCCPRSQKWEHSRWICLRKPYCEQYCDIKMKLCKSNYKWSPHLRNKVTEGKSFFAHFFQYLYTCYRPPALPVKIIRVNGWILPWIAPFE